MLQFNYQTVPYQEVHSRKLPGNKTSWEKTSTKLCSDEIRFVHAEDIGLGLSYLIYLALSCNLSICKISHTY